MKTARVVLLIGFASAAFGTYASPAEACINSIERFKARAAAVQEESQTVKYRVGSDEPAVLKATDDLNAGRNAEVITGLYSHFGFSINQWALNARYVSAAEHEIVYIVAIAMLRVEGAVERYPEHVVSQPKRKTDNVRWAIRAIEGLAFIGYAADRHVAEAWGRDPSLKKAGLEKLLHLHHQGRLQSPFQLQLLARLLREQGRDTEAAGLTLAAK